MLLYINSDITGFTTPSTVITVISASAGRRKKEEERMIKIRKNKRFIICGIITLAALQLSRLFIMIVITFRD
jgi:hypothetical protein